MLPAAPLPLPQAKPSSDANELDIELNEDWENLMSFCSVSEEPSPSFSQNYDTSVKHKCPFCARNFNYIVLIQHIDNCRHPRFVTKNSMIERLKEKIKSFSETKEQVDAAVLHLGELVHLFDPEESKRYSEIVKKLGYSSN